MDLGPATPYVEIYAEETIMDRPIFTSKDIYCSIIYKNKIFKATKLSNTKKLVKLILT